MTSQERLTLTTLADSSGSDKGTRHPHAHHYTRVYDMLLNSRRENLGRMLEIGLLAGGPELGVDADRETRSAPSVEMWLRFFPNAEVCGFDISDFSWINEPRFKFIRGDSGIEADWSERQTWDRST